MAAVFGSWIRRRFIAYLLTSLSTLASTPPPLFTKPQRNLHVLERCGSFTSLEPPQSPRDCRDLPGPRGPPPQAVSPRPRRGGAIGGPLALSGGAPACSRRAAQSSQGPQPGASGAEPAAGPRRGTLSRGRGRSPDSPLPAAPHGGRGEKGGPKGPPPLLRATEPTLGCVGSTSVK